MGRMSGTAGKAEFFFHRAAARRWAGFVVGLIVVCTTASAMGQATRSWSPAANGVFSDPAYWTDGNVPGVDDIAQFGLAGSYEVSFTSDATIYALYINDGAAASVVTFDLGGYKLTTTSTSTSFPALRMNQHGDNTLRLLNGTLDVQGVFRVGQHSSTTGQQTLVVGQDARLIQSGGANLANYSRGTVRVESNGLYSIEDHLYFGNRPEADSIGILTATGPNARIEMGSGMNLYVGQGGSDTVGATGLIEILDGARLDYSAVTGNRRIYLAPGKNTSGTIRVEDPNSYLRTTVLVIGGGASIAGGTGLVRVANGGHVFVAATNTHLRVDGAGTLELDAGTMRANPGATWNAGSTYRLWLHDVGAEPLLVNGDVNLAMDGADGTVNFDLHLGSGFSGEVGQRYTAIRYQGLLSGYFRDLEDGPVPPTIDVDGYVFEVEYGMGSNDSITLHLTVIPEPHTAALLLAGLGVAGVLRRRTR